MPANLLLFSANFGRKAFDRAVYAIRFLRRGNRAIVGSPAGVVERQPGARLRLAAKVASIIPAQVVSPRARPVRPKPVTTLTDWRLLSDEVC